MRTATSRLRGLVLALGLAAGALSCGPGPDAGVLRFATDDFDLRVSADVMPPRAVEESTYTIVVRDKATDEPIANGEGRIFATNADHKTVWNGLEYGPEVGTYRARLRFLTAGEWAMGIQFRRDSTEALQRTHDWRQQVKNETPNPTPATAPVTP